MRLDQFTFIRPDSQLAVSEAFPFLSPEGSGHVYAVEVSNGLVKVGVTTNPPARFAQLRSDVRSRWLARLGEAFVSVPCTNYRAVERAVHRELACHHFEGEYFRGDLALAEGGFGPVDLLPPEASDGPLRSNEVRTLHVTPAIHKELAILAAMSGITLSEMTREVLGVGLEILKAEPLK